MNNDTDTSNEEIEETEPVIETVWLKHPILGIQEHPADQKATLISEGFEAPTQEELDEFNTVVDPALDAGTAVKMRHPDWTTDELAYVLIDKQFVAEHKAAGFLIVK